MKLPVMLLAAVCAATPLAAEGDLRVEWNAASTYVAGSPYTVELTLAAGADGASIAPWMLTAAAFTVDGKALGERAEGALIPLGPSAELTLSFDLGAYLAPSAAADGSFELSYAKGVAAGEPVKVTAFDRAPEGLDFMTMPLEELGSYMVLLQTNRGSMLVELWPDVAPNHSRNYLDLAYTGFYDKTLFHRVSPTFMIQGGDPNTKSGRPNSWGAGNGPRRVKAEFNQKKHVRGVLSAARLGNDVDSATSQFFVMTRANRGLDGKYTAFGMLVDGFDTLDRISKAPGTVLPDGGTYRPNEPQRVEKAQVVRPLGAK
jgi:peptidyl-prolyl cis-trans isomerase B (cyclophilin B)